MLWNLILVHRWLGVASCLLFAMWFATGIVMHFVPFPELTEAERFAGLAPIDLASVAHGPAAAVGVSGIAAATRVRLIDRSDGPIYVISGGSDGSGVAARRATDLADAAVHSESLALSIAQAYARRSGLSAAAAAVAALDTYDQWTVSSDYLRYGPLYRVALHDDRGTELYVSSATGQIALVTTLRMRAWNYVGSVAHWIYPTTLRSHAETWATLVWWLSLVALIGAVAGAVVGMVQIGRDGFRPVSPYGGVKAWHHWLGLLCMPFVLTWIFSGWLSMDDGRLFAPGIPTSAQAAAIAGTPAWATVPADDVQGVAAPAKEVEWFAFGGRIYRRERMAFDRQRLLVAGAKAGRAAPDRALLTPGEIDAAADRLAPGCGPAVAVDADDAYAPAPAAAHAQVYRVACGDVWFQLDGANGALLDELDRSQRAYRWLYRGLHTLDFPVLTARPVLRATLIVGLCGCGLIFSLTGVVIAWRRLRACF